MLPVVPRPVVNMATAVTSDRDADGCRAESPIGEWLGEAVPGCNEIGFLGLMVSSARSRCTREVRRGLVSRETSGTRPDERERVTNCLLPHPVDGRGAGTHSPDRAQLIDVRLGDQ